jgi:hypothetical protein
MDRWISHDENLIQKQLMKKLHAQIGFGIRSPPSVKTGQVLHSEHSPARDNILQFLTQW